VATLNDPIIKFKASDVLATMVARYYVLLCVLRATLQSRYMDTSGWHVPSILEGNDESPEDVFVDSKLCTYVLRITFKQLTDPTSTGESRIVIGCFVEVTL
jgi:hypothetical protein